MGLLAIQTASIADRFSPVAQIDSREYLLDDSIISTDLLLIAATIQYRSLEEVGRVNADTYGIPRSVGGDLQ